MKSIKHVNVGTVGHIDHGRMLQYTGRRSYLDIAGDWDGRQQYVRRLPNPFEPEWIYWDSGLVYVGGRIIHDLTHSLTAIEPDTQGELVLTGPHKGKLYWALEDTISKPLDIGKLLGDPYMNDVFFESNTKKKLVADRKSVIPSRKSIQWAIEMRNWKDKDLFKILGMEQLAPKQLEQLRWSRKDV